MKAIQLLHSAAAIAVVVGSSDGNDHDAEEQPALRHGNRPTLTLIQNAPNDTNATVPVSNITCAAEETPCHVENGMIESCAKPGEVCPCYFNEKRCTDSSGEYYCDSVCCDWGVEERCHIPNPDHPGWATIYCAYIDEGGCPCPDGQTKCGRKLSSDGETLISAGYCTSVCCEDAVDKQGNQLTETCYDINYEPSFCASVEEGGCPCPWKQNKCGATDDWSGYCTTVCCAADEETCFDDRGNKSCSKHSLGGCTAIEGARSHGFWKSRVPSTILAKGTGGQVAYYTNIAERKKELSLAVEALKLSGRHLTEYNEESLRLQQLIKQLEDEEAALFHAIRIREKEKVLVKREEVPFSTW